MRRTSRVQHAQWSASHGAAQRYARSAYSATHQALPMHTPRHTRPGPGSQAPVLGSRDTSVPVPRNTSRSRRPGPATRMSGRHAPQQRPSSLAGPARPPAAGRCAGGGQLQRARPTAAPRPRLCMDAPGGAAGTPCPTACWGPRPCCPVRPCWRLLTATHPVHSWAACTLITISLLSMLCSAEPLRASPSSRGDVRGSPRPSLPFTCDV